jgi:protein TonB
MKTKKTEKANLEKNRLIYFEIGLIFTLSAILVAFEWSKKPSEINNGYGNFLAENQLDQIERTIRKDPEIIKEKPKMTLIINEVDDKNLIIDEPDIFNPEIGANDSYDLWMIPVVDTETFIETIPWIDLSERPKFNGGDPMVEFRKYIAENIVYPQEAIENGIEGRITLHFVIDEKGRMTQVEVVQGVHPSLDREAARVIESSPDWTPGKQGIRAVRVSYYFPVIFRLNR